MIKLSLQDAETIRTLISTAGISDHEADAVNALCMQIDFQYALMDAEQDRGITIICKGLENE